MCPFFIRADQGLVWGVLWTQKRRIARHSYTLHKCRGRHGGAIKGWPINNVCLGDLRVFHCVSFIRADQGLLGAALGFKTEENKKVLRIYGFEGEPGGRGRCGRASANQVTAG